MPLSEQYSSAGLDAAAQRRKKGRKCLFRRFPGKPGRPGGKRLLGRRTSISGPATTERGSLRAHLAELVAGPSIAALYPPRVVCHVLSMPRPRERQQPASLARRLRLAPSKLSPHASHCSSLSSNSCTSFATRRRTPALLQGQGPVDEDLRSKTRSRRERNGAPEEPTGGQATGQPASAALTSEQQLST